MTSDVKLLPCQECGMPCEPGEYHPFAACLMFKGCRQSAMVRANLACIEADRKVRADGGETAWREGWAFAYSGGNLYGDDGELQDNSALPRIDWRRDSAAEIRNIIQERGHRAVAAKPYTHPATDDDALTLAYLSGKHDGQKDVARLVEAANRMLPINTCLDNWNVPDTTEVPLLATLAELRAIKAALAPFTATQQEVQP